MEPEGIRDPPRNDATRLMSAASHGSLPASVQVGGLDRAELLHALRQQGVQLNKAARDLFGDQRFVLSARSKMYGISVLTVADLDFPEGATYGQIMESALASGLAECPLELGPYLRLRYSAQPDAPSVGSSANEGAPSGSITIASTPLDDCDETPKGFYLSHVGEVSWLRGYWSSPDHIWSPADVFVFSRACRAIPA